jgi:hypothetical protein
VKLFNHRIEEKKMTKECPVCNGKGYPEPKHPYPGQVVYQCSACNGTGKWKKPKKSHLFEYIENKILEETMTKKQESESLTITKERVLAASEKCPEAEVIFKELFPDVFEGEYCCNEFAVMVAHDLIHKTNTVDSGYAIPEKKNMPMTTYWEIHYCPHCGRKVDKTIRWTEI